MNKKIRNQAARELASNLGCKLEIAHTLIDAMVVEAKEQIALYNECAVEMA